MSEGQLKKIRDDLERLLHSLDEEAPSSSEQQDVAALKLKIAELEEQVHKMHLKNTLLSGELFELRMTLSSVQRQARDSDEKLNEAQRTIDELQRRNKELDRANANLRSSNSELKQRLGKFKNQNVSSEVQMELEEVLRQRTELQRANANLRNVNSELKKKLNASSCRVIHVPYKMRMSMTAEDVKQKFAELTWEQVKDVQIGKNWIEVRLETEQEVDRLVTEHASFEWNGVTVHICRF
eukprot:TRINITY_DN1923_c0_g1_i1.p1 TRINITY_DN1923_c0_g1~~TRINITY_DN1923_c0_g1_i1.p1  ORF type:complete len:239 (-),score=79.00 TRINITY_DN1923_c0_g1_i1:132-848(-)